MVYLPTFTNNVGKYAIHGAYGHWLGKHVNVHLRDYSGFLLLLNAQKECLQIQKNQTCPPKENSEELQHMSTKTASSCHFLGRLFFQTKRNSKKTWDQFVFGRTSGDQNLDARTPHRIQRSCLHEISPHQTFSEWWIGGLGPGGLDIWDPPYERDCYLGGSPIRIPNPPGPTGTWMSQEVLVKRLSCKWVMGCNPNIPTLYVGYNTFTNHLSNFQRDILASRWTLMGFQ